MEARHPGTYGAAEVLGIGALELGVAEVALAPDVLGYAGLDLLR